LVFKSLAFCPLTRKLGLLFGNGNSGHLAAISFRSVGSESSPAASDFKDVISWLEFKFVTKCLVFSGLRFFKLLIGFLKLRT
jgi:hypothetical protein